MTRRLLTGVLALALLALIAPAGASAAPWTCDASVMRGTIGPAPAVEPITANQSTAECTTQSAGGAPPAGLPGGASGSLAFARTRADGAATNPAGQRVSAEASLGELRIPLLPGLPGLPAPPSIPAVTVPGFGSIDLNPAIQALAAPSGDLIGIRALDASVTGQCSSGKPLITGTWSVAGLTVLGVPISTNSAVSRTLTIDSRSIDPSNIDPAAVAPAGVDLSAFSAALRPVLDALPNIAIPEALARLQVTPGQEIRGSNRLTQRALSISLSIAGQSVVDFVAGEATVGGSGVRCGEATATQALRCTSRRLVLIDVVRRKGRVRFLGAADRRLAGARGDPLPGHRQARRPPARRQGRAVPRERQAAAAARARHQPRALRGAAWATSARSRSSSRGGCGSPRSRRRAGGSWCAGRISQPLADPIERITVTRRVSCGRVEVVKRFKPRKNGRFRVTLSGAKTRQVATFRFRTLVRFSEGDPKLFRTFTLPQYVDIG